MGEHRGIRVVGEHGRERMAIPRSLDTWRCPKCGTILAKVRLVRGCVLEIKCPRCNTFAVKEAA